MVHKLVEHQLRRLESDTPQRLRVADDERRALEACPHVVVVTIPNAGHFTLNEEPGRIAALIIQMVSADAAR